MEGSSRAHVEETVFEHIKSSDSANLEEAIVHGQMITEDIYRGSIVLHLRPITDDAVQTLLNAKCNDKLLEMIFGILKKVSIENIIDDGEPLKSRCKFSTQSHLKKSKVCNF